jgi:uncharacterized membrane protein YhiD involved in acid resistance
MDTTNFSAPLSLSILLVNLFLGIGLSLLIAWYYVRFGKSLSNRSKFAPILPMLTLITLLVISIVKSSLALSLGLVGALSIVRFRTAIKDPEELIFLFLAIAVGLGLGADQRIPTIAAVAVIMLYLFGRTLFDRNRNKTNTVYLNIQIENNPTESNLFDQVNSLLLDELREIDLRRLDQHKDQVQMTYYVNVTDQKKLVSLMDRLKQRYPDSIVSVVEQNNLLGG